MSAGRKELSPAMPATASKTAGGGTAPTDKGSDGSHAVMQKTKYPVVLSDALLGKDSKEAYTGIRYNYKPTDVSPNLVRLRPSAKELGSYDLGFSDNGKKYSYSGLRTPGDVSTDGTKKYVLVFDPGRQAFMLHRLDSILHMNVTCVPGNTDAESLREKHPPLDLPGPANGGGSGSRPPSRSGVKGRAPTGKATGLAKDGKDERLRPSISRKVHNLTDEGVDNPLASTTKSTSEDKPIENGYEKAGDRPSPRDQSRDALQQPRNALPTKPPIGGTPKTSQRTEKTTTKSQRTPSTGYQNQAAFPPPTLPPKPPAPVKDAAKLKDKAKPAGPKPAAKMTLKEREKEVERRIQEEEAKKATDTGPVLTLPVTSAAPTIGLSLPSATTTSSSTSSFTKFSSAANSQKKAALTDSDEDSDEDDDGDGLLTIEYPEGKPTQTRRYSPPVFPGLIPSPVNRRFSEMLRDPDDEDVHMVRTHNLARQDEEDEELEMEDIFTAYRQQPMQSDEEDISDEDEDEEPAQQTQTQGHGNGGWDNIEVDLEAELEAELDAAGGNVSDSEVSEED